MDHKTIEISWTSLWRILFFAAFAVVLFQGRQILLGLFLAIVISSGLESAVNFLEQRKLPRTLGVIFIFLLAILVLLVIAYTAVPRVIIELGSVFSNLSSSAAESLWGPLFDIKVSQAVGSLVGRLSSEFFSGNLSPLGIFSKALGGATLAVAVLVSSFYLSLSRDGVERFLRVVLPSDYEKQGLRIYERSRRKIGAWFRMQIFLSAIMGLLVWLSLALLGVKHAFLLGVFAGIFELVPFVGPILSGAVSVLVALPQSAALALYVLIAFLALHQLESHVLVPIFSKRAVGLHPVVVIIALLIGAEIWGILGAIVAVPAAAVFEEVIEEWSSARKKPVAISA